MHELNVVKECNSAAVPTDYLKPHETQSGSSVPPKPDPDTRIIRRVSHQHLSVIFFLLTNKKDDIH